MVKKHRDSQRRYYVDGGIYFVTCKTSDNYPFFREQVFCDLFVENLRVCKELKQFKLFAWVLVYDHFHLLVRPNDKNNISEIMRSLKTSVSCDINRTIFPEGAVPAPRLRMIYQNKLNIFDYQNQFLKKHPTQNPHPTFRWQKSYYDHITRNDTDFGYHFEYIKWNPVKHKMSDDWPYVFTNPEYQYFTDQLEL
jgi:REP element-mobilizing transposase RayT